ncbi:ATP-binding protein [bacterium]|nr:ATP-binding protein [bacterium]
MGSQPVERHLCIPGKTENLEFIRNFVSGMARKAGFNDKDVNKIELAIDEACTNVIEHAYRDTGEGDIDIDVEYDTQKFKVVVADQGRSFVMEDIKIPDMEKYMAELKVGGLGIYLMRTLMDEVDYRSKPGARNEVRMVKYLPGKS